MNNFFKVLFLVVSLSVYSQKKIAGPILYPVENPGEGTGTGIGGQNNNNPPPERYKDDIYTEGQITITQNMYYGANPVNGAALELDYYTATTDVITDRPAVFLVYSGGFAGGYKEQMVEQGVSLAKKGYAVFAINYRLLGADNYVHGTVNTSALCAGKVFNDMAWYWAMQDLNAAIKVVALNKIAFKVDPNKVFVYGESAGAITALNFAYTTQQEVYDTFPGVNFANYNFLGDLDNSTYPLAKTQTYTVLGVACAGGALTKSNYLDSDETIPVVMLHNPCDLLVPYHVLNNGLGDINLFNTPCNKIFYGSRYIYDQMGNWCSSPKHKLFVNCEIDPDFNHGLDGLGVFYNNKTPEFFYDILNNNPQISTSIEVISGSSANVCNDAPGFWCDSPGAARLNNNQKVVGYKLDNLRTFFNDLEKKNEKDFIGYPNPTSGKVSFNIGLWEGESVTINVCDILGNVIKSEKVSVIHTKDKYTINLIKEPIGVYFVQIVSKAGTQSSKIIKE